MQTTTETMSKPFEMPSLIQESRVKYIKALRSGNYNQCIGAYSKQGSFCAVGLAMNLAHDGCDIENESVDDMLVNTTEDLYLDPRHIQNLIEMNDEFKMSFNQIADKLVDAGFLTEDLYGVDLTSSVNTSTEKNNHA